MSFDYGVPEELLQVSDSSEIKRWPTEGEKVGLFDVDTVPYSVS